MKPTLVDFKSNNNGVLQPCKKVLVSLRYKLKRRLTILFRRRPLRLTRSPSSKSRSVTRSSKKTLKGKVSSFFSTLFRHKKKMNSVRVLSNSFSNGGSGAAIERLLSFPSPKKTRTPKLGENEKNVELDACRSFEKYLVEMIVEEGKVKDLMDVEELLYCWSNLKCPVFIGLVSRFYGELCKDLFMDSN